MADMTLMAVLTCILLQYLLVHVVVNAAANFNITLPQLSPQRKVI